ncbi:MAG: hypothetical protein ACRC53_04330 [Plesiomonas sp.]|uniref:hypothetical protein n=1 Tax=Plesiomonas sp. TaxID=2486279 RepID=UPI003F411EF0
MTNNIMGSIISFGNTPQNPSLLRFKDADSITKGIIPEIELSTLDEIVDFFRMLFFMETKKQAISYAMSDFFDEIKQLQSQSTSLCNNKSNQLDIINNEGLRIFACCMKTIELTDSKQIQRFTFKFQFESALEELPKSGDDYESKAEDITKARAVFFYNGYEISHFSLNMNDYEKIISNTTLFHLNKNEQSVSIQNKAIKGKNSPLLNIALTDFISKSSIR